MHQLRSLFVLTCLVGYGLLSTAVQDAETTDQEYITTEVPTPLPAPEHPGLKHERSADRLELGKALFFDTLLSSDKTISCASCHKPEHAFADSVALSLGVKNQPALVNSPSLLNRYLGTSFMWDGRFASLEEQVTDPIDNPREMGLGVDKALIRLKASKSYVAQFKKAWPDKGISKETLAGSLAHFIRHLRTGNSPVDAFRAGDAKTLNDLEKRGLWLYESRGRCWQCHGGANFSDEGLHNTGVGVKDGKPVDGRFAVTKKEEDRGRFKTPSLRGVAYTAPYMHDGSMKTLKEVVEFYRKGGNKNAQLDSRMSPIDMDDNDVEALVAFLKALSR